jgi:integrase
VTNLEWSDVDFDKETVSISKQLQYLPEFGIYEMESAKTDSGNRIISIPIELIELLREYKIWQDEEKSKWGDKWVETNKLFTKENGESIHPHTPSQWFNKFIKRHNLPPLTFHQIRHTNASLLIGQGVDAATVSKRLGHANVAVTLKTYTHAIKEHDREAADKLGNLIKKKK